MRPRGVGAGCREWVGGCGREGWRDVPRQTTEGPARRAEGLALDLASQCSPTFSPSWLSWTMMLSVLGWTEGLPTGWPWRPSEGISRGMCARWLNAGETGGGDARPRAIEVPRESGQACRGPAPALSQWNAGKKGRAWPGLIFYPHRLCPALSQPLGYPNPFPSSNAMSSSCSRVPAQPSRSDPQSLSSARPSQPPATRLPAP